MQADHNSLRATVESMGDKVDLILSKLGVEPPGKVKCPEDLPERSDEQSCAVLGNPEEACKMARQAFEDAIAELDSVSEDSYKVRHHTLCFSSS